MAEGEVKGIATSGCACFITLISRTSPQNS
jgi:hypothetical protein